MHLAAGGLGATWNTSGAYTALQTDIVFGNVPQEPDRVITLTCYGSSDDPSLSTSVVSLQVRTRCEGQEKRKVDDLDDAVFNILHSAQHLIVGTGSAAVHIVQCQRKSQASLGQDVNGRWSDSSNYDVTVHRPSANRT